jgi:Na+-transporting methylmalonyl-CoA/oxaloacetate decarboxylase gamma subunit
MHFFSKPETIYEKIPFVSIVLFILAIVLKTIQKVKNDQNYFQKKVRTGDEKALNPLAT